MYEFSNELPKDLRLRRLRNSKISRKLHKSFELMASPRPATQKPNFYSCTRKLQMICCKNLKKATILLDFENLSTLFCHFSVKSKFGTKSHSKCRRVVVVKRFYSLSSDVLLHHLPNRLQLGILEYQEILRKSLKSLELIASPQPATQKSNLDSCA